MQRKFRICVNAAHHPLALIRQSRRLRDFITGVLIAQSSCFPREVVDILAEYNGEDALPSTKESALVHMVEALVTRFEILDKNTVSSTWNYEVVIYQTMNETSATGIYDASGLTMNQFLKIREFFVKGENLF